MYKNNFEDTTTFFAGQKNSIFVTLTHTKKDKILHFGRKWSFIRFTFSTKKNFFMSSLLKKILMNIHFFKDNNKKIKIYFPFTLLSR